MGRIVVVYRCRHRRSRQWEKEDIRVKAETPCPACLTRGKCVGKQLEIWIENLIGDTLLATPAIRSWKEHNPGGCLVCHTRRGSSSHQMLQGNPYIDDLVLYEKAGEEPQAVRMDAWAAHTWARQNGKSLAEGFGALIDTPVSDLRYDYAITAEEEARGKELALELGGGKPVVVVARHSASCSSNDPKCNYVPNKCVPNVHWAKVSQWLLREGYVPVAVGSKEDLDDRRYSEWYGARAYGKPLRDIAALCKAAACTATVDTGLRHLSASVGGHLYTISCAIDLQLIHCVPIHKEQRIYEQVLPIPAVNCTTLMKGIALVLGKT